MNQNTPQDPSIVDARALRWVIAGLVAMGVLAVALFAGVNWALTPQYDDTVKVPQSKSFCQDHTLVKWRGQPIQDAKHTYDHVDQVCVVDFNYATD